MRKRATTAVTVVLALALLAWRLPLGASTDDDAHVVTLALRLARGDIAFGDEMNLQVTGAFLAVPFVWVWDHMVGPTGIALAARVWFVVVALAVGAVTVRGLRTRYAAWPATAATVAALLGLPYQLPLLSYASVPVLALVLATAAGIALRETRSTRWAVTLGLTSAAGAIASPQLTPAFALALLTALARVPDRRARVTTSIAALTLGTAVSTLVLLSAGPTAVAESLRFLLDSRGSGELSGISRAGRALGTYEGLRFPLYWPLLVCLALSLLGVWRAQWRAVGLAASAAAVLWVAGVSALAATGVLPQLWFGNTAAALESLMVLVLTVPVAAERRWRRVPGAAGELIAALLPAVVAAAIVAATTNSGPEYSVHGATLAGLFLVLVCQWSVAVVSLPPLPAAVSAVPAAGMALVLLVLPFGGASSLAVDTRLTSGPWAGLVTTSSKAVTLSAVGTAVEGATRGGRSILVLGASGAYLAARGPIATPSVWLDQRPGNERALQWFTRTGTRPDVVLIMARTEQAAGGSRAWSARDPLRAWVDDAYRPVRVIEGVGTEYARR
ncbi:hypothetical protein GCM10027039_42590 [Terrabacter koreensis]